MRGCRLDSYGQGWGSESDSRELSKDRYYGICARRMLVVRYRRFGTSYRGHLEDKEVQELSSSSSCTWTTLPLNMGPMGCFETSVTNYQPTLRTIREKRRPQLHRGGNPKFRIVRFLRIVYYEEYIGQINNTQLFKKGSALLSNSVRLFIIQCADSIQCDI